MLIKKKGETIEFACQSCGCEFVAGIRSVTVTDGNYYCACPMCGADCHTDASKMQAMQEEYK